MLRTQRSADIASGAFLILVAVVSLFASSQIAGLEGDRLHPRTLPIILGWMLLAGALGLLVMGLRTHGEPKAIDWPEGEGTRRVLVTLVSIAVYMALLEPFGFPLASVFFVTFLTWYLGRYRILWAAFAGVASGLAILVLFIELLGLSFPLGLLELFL